MDNPRGDQMFILDGDNLGDFKEEYKKLLGGLLVDHQTFLINEIDADGNLVRHLCAFNLLGGALKEEYFEDPLTPVRPSDYILAPKIPKGSFDKTLYDETDPNSIINVINAFKENGVLIGYQREGANSLDRKQYEYPLWMRTCTSLAYIEYAF